MDRILRKTLPRPAAYNLRRSIQMMIKKGILDGHFDKDVFVRTLEKKPKKSFKPSRSQTQAAVKMTKDLLNKNDSFDIELVEKETGVPRQILRRTLIILLGEGLIEGTIEGNTFVIAKEQGIREFLRTLQKELEA